MSFSFDGASPPLLLFAIGRPSTSIMTTFPSEPTTGFPSGPNMGPAGTWVDGPDSSLLNSFLFSFIGSSHVPMSTVFLESNFITSYFHPLRADDMSLYSANSPSGSLELSSASASGGVGCMRGVADLRRDDCECDWDS